MVEHICGNLLSRHDFAKRFIEFFIARMQAFCGKLRFVFLVSLVLNFVKRPSSIFLKKGGFFRIKSIKKNLDSRFKELDLPL